MKNILSLSVMSRDWIRRLVDFLDTNERFRRGWIKSGLKKRILVKESQFLVWFPCHSCPYSRLATVFSCLDLLSLQSNRCWQRHKRSGWLTQHLGLDLIGHTQKGLFHILGGLGGCFQKLNPQRICELFSLFGRNRSFASQICLVANQEFLTSLTSIAIDFADPLLDIYKGSGVCDIINHNNAMSASIVGRGNCSKSFLSGRVPNLQFNRLSIQFGGSNFLGKKKETRKEARKWDSTKFSVVSNTDTNSTRTSHSRDAKWDGLTKSTPIVEV